METPSSSTRRVTRSQTRAAAAAGNRKIGESEKRTTKSTALVDITNDSPIVGLAMQSLRTPSSSAATSKKKRIGGGGQGRRTPGSGEALLRGQVKALLQKVEEENCNSPTIILNPAADDPGSLPYLTPLIIFPKMTMDCVESEDRITRSLLLDFSDKSSDSSSSSIDELCEGIGKVLRLKGLPTPKGKHIRFLQPHNE